MISMELELCRPAVFESVVGRSEQSLHYVELDFEHAHGVRHEGRLGSRLGLSMPSRRPCFFRPALVEQLYGIEPIGDLAVLILHRSALFLAVTLVCGYAAIEPTGRRAAALVTAISVTSFLALYALAGMPAGALRSIAIGDLVAIPPLLCASWNAWRSQIA